MSQSQSMGISDHLAVSCVLVLPLLFGVDAIWLSIVVAEVLALAVTASFVFGLRKTYGYW